MIHLNYRDTRPIYAQIEDGIRQQIAAGILQEGKKLESVRELATRLAINPNTIQRAYRELEAQGWIASVPGKGSFVCGIPDPAVAAKHTALEQFDAMCLSLLQQGITPAELRQRLEKLGGKDHA